MQTAKIKLVLERNIRTKNKHGDFKITIQIAANKMAIKKLPWWY